MNNEITKTDSMRAAVRPMILFMMILSSVAFIWEALHGTISFDGEAGRLAVLWITTTVAACGEWVLERPVLKALGKA